MAPNGAHVVKLGISALNEAWLLALSLVDCSIDLVADIVNVVSFSLELLALSPDFIKLLLRSIEVSVELLKLSLLAEEVLSGVSVLVIQDLLSLEVSSLGTEKELVTVVLVSHLQVGQSVKKSLDFLLALLDLAIELITITLKLFLMLSSLDDIGLGTPYID